MDKVRKKFHGDCALRYCVVESGERIEATTAAVVQHRTGCIIWVPAGTTLIDCINRVRSTARVVDRAELYCLSEADGMWAPVVPEYNSYKLEAGDVFYIKLVRPHTLPAAADGEEEFRKLAEAVPPFSWPDGGEPSPEALQKYLLDFDCLAGRVPVTITRLCAESKALFHSESILAQVVGNVIVPPLPGSGEQVINSRIVDFCKILERMRSCASPSHRLSYLFSMDHAGEASAPASSVTTGLRKRKRPDFLLEKNALILLGEGKELDRDFSVACDEIRLKLAKVPAWVFGGVTFCLAFAVAGLRWQLFVKRGSCDVPEPVVDEFNLSDVGDRLKLALLFIKLYFVCLAMMKKQTSTGMLPLFRKHVRSLSSIELDGNGCVKVIENWGAFRSRFGVALPDIAEAYSIAVPQLAFAVVQPSASRDRYSVRTGPLGLPAETQVKSVGDCKQLARDMLAALGALHERELVHRDVRLDNIIWWPDRKFYVLIDLECSCEAGRLMGGELLVDYTNETLVDLKYTTTSDLHQLGVLMTKLKPLLVPDEQCSGFISMLQSHRPDLKADKMRGHPWLAP